MDEGDLTRASPARSQGAAARLPAFWEVRCTLRTPGALKVDDQEQKRYQDLLRQSTAIGLGGPGILGIESSPDCMAPVFLLFPNSPMQPV